MSAGATVHPAQLREERPTTDASEQGRLVASPSESAVSSAMIRRSILPSADAFVSATRPKRNFGSTRKLHLDAAPIRRAYLRFSLRSMSGTISSAKLRLYAPSGSRKGYAVHVVGAARWGEYSLNYRNAPRFSGVWGSSGDVHAGTWTSVDVTGLAKAGRTLSVVLTTRDRGDLRLASREYEGHRPRLVVSLSGSSPPPDGPGIPGDLSCSGGLTDVYPGDDIAAAVSAAQPGDTIRVHAGTYPKQTLTTAVSAKTCIEAAPGESAVVRGFDLSSAANLDVSGFTVAAFSPSWGFRFSSGAHDITVHDNRIHGGDYGIKFYEATNTWPKNIIVRDNDISGAVLDNVHVDGARGIVLRHNHIHDVDLVTTTQEHHDGIQVIAGEDILIERNTISLTNPPGTDGPNQGIIVGHRDPLPSTRRVSNVVIASNLVDHWAGIGILLAGVDGAKIVNNTVYDNGAGNSKTNQFLMSSKNDAADYQNNSVEVWNNVFGKMWRGERSAAPIYCGYNLVWPSTADRCDTEGELGADPLFADHNTYRLQPASPALDSGSSRAGTPGYDLDGLPFGAPDRGAHRS